MNNNYNQTPGMNQQPIETNIQPSQPITQPVDLQTQNKPSIEPGKSNNKNKVIIIIAVVLLVVAVSGILIYFNSQKTENTKEPKNQEQETIKDDNQENEKNDNKTEEDNDKTLEDEDTSVGEETKKVTDIDEGIIYEAEEFRMTVSDVFTMTGKGTVVTGRVTNGVVRVGDNIKILDANGKLKNTTTVIGLEYYREAKELAKKEDVISITLKDISKDQVASNDILSKAATRKAIISNQFTADVYILNKEEGGRHTPFFDGYKPQFSIGAEKIYGTISLKDDKEMVMPGEKVSFTTTLDKEINLVEGAEFRIYEGTTIIGTGKITKIY